LIALIVSTFVVIFLAELPDKTALASLALATKYRARDVIAGAWAAFLVQTLVAIAAGSVLNLLPATPVHVAAGVGFLVFAALAMRRNEEAEEAAEEEEVAEANAKGMPPMVASFLVVFAAEWGDLTQLATAALVARTGEPLAVGIGATAALWSVTLIAASIGSQLGRFLSPVLLQRSSAVLFAVVGTVVIVTALI
jgi:Ca2+/H+ antiporter, TMEM165/GDT1 family